LPYKSFLYPYGAYFGLGFTIVITVVSPIFAAWPKDGSDKIQWGEFLAAFITIPIYVALFVGYKIIYKTKIVNLMDVDLRTGNINLDHKIEAGVFTQETSKGGLFGKAIKFIA
jgi:amino acid permease